MTRMSVAIAALLIAAPALAQTTTTTPPTTPPPAAAQSALTDALIGIVLDIEADQIAGQHLVGLIAVELQCAGR